MNSSLIDFGGFDSETPNEDIIERVLKDISGGDYENESKIVYHYFRGICWNIFHSNYIDTVVHDYQITLLSLLINNTDSNRANIDMVFHNYSRLFYKVSKRELSLLKSYVSHVYSCGIKSDYIPGLYLFDPDEWRGVVMGVDADCVTYPTNEKTISDIKKCIQNILSYKEIISNLENEVSNFSHSSMPVFRDGGVGIVDGVDISSLSSYLENLDNHIRELDGFYYSYSFLKNNLMFLEMKREKMRKEILGLALYKRTLDFDINCVSGLSNDVFLLIKEFVGNNYLEGLRKSSISLHYFSYTKVDLTDLLRTWRKKDLRNYMKKVYLHYSFRLRDIRSMDTKLYVFPVTNSSKKDNLIRIILCGSYKGSFYELHRDVWFLTRILKDKRLRLGASVAGGGRRIGGGGGGDLSDSSTE
jgi:hypothetical protein